MFTTSHAPMRTRSRRTVESAAGRRRTLHWGRPSRQVQFRRALAEQAVTR